MCGALNLTFIHVSGRVDQVASGNSSKRECCKSVPDADQKENGERRHRPRSRGQGPNGWRFALGVGGLTQQSFCSVRAARVEYWARVSHKLQEV